MEKTIRIVAKMYEAIIDLFLKLYHFIKCVLEENEEPTTLLCRYS